MLKNEAYVGQIVRLRVGGRLSLAKITKINPKNIKVTTADGTRWNCSPSYLNPALPGEVERFEAEAAAAAAAAPLMLGSLVRFKGGSGDNYVVIGRHGDSWRIALLGGDDGRYLRGVSAEQLEVIDFNVEVN